MARVRDLLYRFRPTGAPGAANAAGVPADRAVEQTAELEPVLAMLAATQRDCAAIVERARVEATDIRSRCADQARTTLATAHSKQAAERAAAAAQVQQQGRAAIESGSLATLHEPSAVRQHAAQVMPLHVGHVVDAVRSMLGEDAPTGTPRSGPP